MKDRYYYINKFEEKFCTGCKSIAKTFYRQKFDWRFEFYFLGPNFISIHQNSSWLALKEFCDTNAIEYKTRIERSSAFFTKDLRAVDYILNNNDLCHTLGTVEYTSDAYNAAFDTKDQISTDVKLVSKVPDYPYLVSLGKMGWNDSPARLALTQYLVANSSSFVFKGYYADSIERMSKHVKKGIAHGMIYDGFQFYAKDFDDIMMLHLVAPGKVVKVVKLVEKRKLNES